MREETKNWGDYEKLPEEIPEFPLIRRMLLGAVSVVQTPRLRALETNQRRVAKLSETMDPCFVGSNSKEKPKGDDGQGGSRRSEESMQQEPDQAEKEDDKTSTGRVSSLNFIFLSDFENGADALETTEPADEGTSTREPQSAFLETSRNLPESGSPSNSKDTEQREPRRRRIECAARAPFLGMLPKEE